MADKRPTVRQKYGKRNQDHRDRSDQWVYDKHHRRWRKAILARDPICVHCGREPATEADHIIPIKQGGSRFSLDAGQGLCKSCHSRKTARERHG